MKSNSRGILTRTVLSALALLMMLPVAGFAQGRGRGKPTDIFVNGHDARDGRYDRDDRRDDRYDRDERRRQRDYERERRRRERANRDYDDDDYNRDRDRRNSDDYWRNRNRNDDYNRRNGGYYGNNGGYYGSRDEYPNYGGSFQLRQTALNAGYNEGIKEGRNDRNRGDRYDFRDEGAYRSATKDYSSSYGDRSLYQQYFRMAFENGYRAGYNGY